MFIPTSPNTSVDPPTLQSLAKDYRFQTDNLMMQTDDLYRDARECTRSTLADCKEGCDELGFMRFGLSQSLTIEQLQGIDTQHNLNNVNNLFKPISTLVQNLKITVGQVQKKVAVIQRKIASFRESDVKSSVYIRFPLACLGYAGAATLLGASAWSLHNNPKTRQLLGTLSAAAACATVAGVELEEYDVFTHVSRDLFASNNKLVELSVYMGILQVRLNDVAKQINLYTRSCALDIRSLSNPSFQPMLTSRINAMTDKSDSPLSS